MKIGYARVSTTFQNLDLQLDALKAAGCEKVHTEKMTGSVKERPVLEELLSKIKEGYIRKGDTIVVYKLDRLSRTRKHIFEIHDLFEEYGIHLKSIKEEIDTTTPMGRAMFGMLAILAELEREMIRERTQAGLEAARSRGREGGRPKADQGMVNKALKLYDSKEYSIKDITQMTGIKKPTLYKYLKERELVNNK